MKQEASVFNSAALESSSSNRPPSDAPSGADQSDAALIDTFDSQQAGQTLLDCLICGDRATGNISMSIIRRLLALIALMRMFQGSITGVCHATVVRACGDFFGDRGLKYMSLRQRLLPSDCEKAPLLRLQVQPHLRSRQGPQEPVQEMPL
jgi:hypothetical protein